MPNTNLHLPDCTTLAGDTRDRCDCGKPRHPLGHDKAIARRPSDLPSQKGLRLTVIPKSQLLDGERDYSVALPPLPNSDPRWWLNDKEE